MCDYNQAGGGDSNFAVAAFSVHYYVVERSQIT